MILVDPPGLVLFLVIGSIAVAWLWPVVRK